MIKSVILRGTAVAAAILPLVMSCTYKDLCYNHEEHSGKEAFLIKMDWSHLSEHPTGMTLMFFPQDGGAPVKHITNNVDSTSLSLPIGTYNVLAFNQTVEEYESISFHDLDSWDDMYISIADGAEPGYSREPAELIVGTKSGFTVTQHMIDHPGADSVVLELKPHPVAVLTTVRVLISGIQYARGANGSISGMAKRFYLTRNCTGSETTSFALTGWTVARSNGNAAPEPGMISKSFVSFGLPGVHYTQEDLEEWSTRADIDPVQNLLLSVNIPLVDMETTISADFNVSDRYSFPEHVFDMLVEVGSAPPGGGTPIDEDASHPVELPEVTGQGGGFNVTVEDWGEEVVYDIEII